MYVIYVNRKSQGSLYYFFIEKKYFTNNIKQFLFPLCGKYSKYVSHFKQTYCGKIEIYIKDKCRGKHFTEGFPAV